MFKILILSIAIIVAVLVLTIFAISKGYSYEHKVDPLPDNNQKDNDKKK